MTSSRSPRRSVRALLSAALAVALLAGGTSAVADYDDEIREYDRQLRQQREEREELAREREALESRLEGTNADLATAYLALEDANARLPLAEAALAEAEDALAAAEREEQAVSDRLTLAESELGDLGEQLAEGDAQIESTRSSIGELARSTYRGGASLSGLSVVLNADSSEEFIRQTAIVDTAVRTQTKVITDLETITAVNRNRELRQQAVRDRIDQLHEQAEQAVAAADEARAAADAHRREIVEIQAQQTALAAELEELRGRLNEDLAQKEADDDRLAGIIAGIEADRAGTVAEREAERREQERRERERRERERAAARSNSGSSGGGQSSSGGGGGGSSSGGSSSGSMVPPVPNPLYVTSPYGMRMHPLAGYEWFHAGVDIRSSCGNPQVAAASGTVKATIPAPGNASHGNQVIIDHGTMNGSGYITVTNHLSRFNVRVGQWVDQGDVIGYTGMTGNVTGCHVHFEVWKNGSTINPMNLPGWLRSN
ncbi:Murein DD-endopeptidase MepM and murein hydrolase activator NlpD, contain LysM domain [Georgenia satyanarayanai]|uniref:Murein DD-endopeptidase MepM and murein hydrolase activator NlpD, contain LysM domain n=1 Tax=Georgenia satyanarayanai TaxID=860221 RepID=A0A2Y9A9I9_9MICO|nr:M23 family metallopeptidase [Georgenia satyanarayanai]PYG00539.1 murein DD-endopeptidase MepM/ murein hydrolase activator NlpD [Georgenia satyanarayanai]SSA39928.1 Murein DD-endopeptidase MepM and murein hydrolase activator NlpD, contain LysM domain [Georgenia satyanarayanai]